MFILSIIGKNNYGDYMKKNRKKNSIIFIFFFSALILIYFSLYYIYIKYVIPKNDQKYQIIQTQVSDSYNSS